MIKVDVKCYSLGSESLQLLNRLPSVVLCPFSAVSFDVRKLRRIIEAIGNRTRVPLLPY